MRYSFTYICYIKKGKYVNNKNAFLPTCRFLVTNQRTQISRIFALPVHTWSTQWSAHGVCVLTFATYSESEYKLNCTNQTVMQFLELYKMQTCI